MTEGMPHNELLRRAMEWILSERGLKPDRPLRPLLDEACMRFNLTPNDDIALHNLLKNPAGQPVAPEFGGQTD